jgi:surface protein
LRSVNQNAFSNPLFRFKENGITIEYTGNLVGDTGVLLATGETYTAVDNTTLFAMDVNTDDFTKVVTSLCTNFQDLFWATTFSQNIGSWDTSNVTNFKRMFFNTDSFNQNIGSWNVSNATNMDVMFRFNDGFNQDLSSWCVSQFATEPSNFSDNALNWVLPKPNWGAPC